MRVLLVEDDAMIAQGLQTALRQGGFAVDWMRDGKSAAGALQATVFDLVLLDLGLPLRDGIDRLAPAVRSDRAAPLDGGQRGDSPRRRARAFAARGAVAHACGGQEQAGELLLDSTCAAGRTPES